jgi:amino acid efflux transporter
MSQLKRSLGIWGLVVHYISSVMGVGVVVLPGIALSVAGPASLLAWIILIIFSYPFALIFARMSMRFPNSGGVIDFIEATLGRSLARKTAIFLMITLVVANPLLGIAAARYLGEALNITTNRNVLLIGYLIILSSVFVNLFGIRLSVRLQAMLLMTLITIIVVVCSFSLQYGNPGNLTPFIPHGNLAIGSAIVICFFGFVGWENSAPVAEEVVDPERTFPKAIFLGVILVGLIYLYMAVTVTLVLPKDISYSAASTSFSYLLKTIGGTSLASMGSIMAAGLMCLTTNAWTLGSSRFLFSMARNGDLPSFLSQISGRNSIPRNAILMLGLLYGITVLSLWFVDGTELTIINLSSSGFLLFFLISFISAAKAPLHKTDKILALSLAFFSSILLLINGLGLLFCFVTWGLAELAYFFRKSSTKELQ